MVRKRLENVSGKTSACVSAHSCIDAERGSERAWSLAAVRIDAVNLRPSPLRQHGCHTRGYRSDPMWDKALLVFAGSINPLFGLLRSIPCVHAAPPHPLSGYWHCPSLYRRLFIYIFLWVSPRRSRFTRLVLERSVIGIPVLYVYTFSECISPLALRCSSRHIRILHRIARLQKLVELLPVYQPNTDRISHSLTRS